jgi:hypothetical protein
MYRIDGEDEWQPDRILHIQGLSDDALVGYNLVAIAREALGLALASTAFASAFFGNGTRFGGVLSSDQDLDEEQKKEITDSIEKLHAKADKAFRLLVLGAGFKYEQAGVKPNEAEMSKIRDQQVQEVARFLNMPLHKLKLAIPGAVSYASVEMADLDYYKGPILTWSTAWEQELDAKLIPSLEWGRQYFKHNNNAFLRGDIKTRYEAFAVLRNIGVASANEIRELEDWNPQPGDQGDLYMIQSGFMPLDKSADLVQSQIDKNNTPPPAPAPPAPSGGGNESNAARLAQLEAAVADAQAKYAEEREARIQSDAFGAATMAERDERRASEQQALDRLMNLEILAAQLKADVARETEQRTIADAALDAAEALVVEARNEHAAAVTAAEQAQQTATSAALTITQLQGELEAARVAEGQLRAEHAGALEAAGVAAADRTATLERDLAAALASLDEATRTCAVIRSAATDAELRVASLEAALAAATDTSKATRKAEIDRLSSVIKSHRGLIADVLRRLIERETDRARSRQDSPAKLKAWTATFYGPFEESFVEAILPAIRVHLAWRGSGEDPRDLAAGLAQQHVERSRRELSALFGSTGGDFYVAVEHVLRRWEKDRPEAVADALLEDEVAHLRELERQL